MASRSLDDLTDEAKEAAELWLNDCELEGLDVLIVCTYRPDSEQDQLYALGRTKKGHIVTNARGGESGHNKRIAIDYCIMKNGKCMWQDSDGFKRAGILAERRGFSWAGRWSGKLKETGHIQLKKGL